MKGNGDGLLFMASAMAACLALGCIVSTSPEYGPQSRPACVTGNQAGDALTVRLGVVYDAASEYWYDDVVTSGQSALPSCAGRDGLQADSVLTFTLTASAGSLGTVCSPWRATLQPEALASPQLLDDQQLPHLAGMTIADASMEGTLAGRLVDADRGLFTPSGDPHGVLAPRQRPPLVVTRGLRDFVTGERCFDAWVAAWEPAP
jgi:hypothetical protein